MQTIVESKIRRLSFKQLKALSFLCLNQNHLVSSSYTGKQMGVVGKQLGGVFSSLSRQKIGGQSLIIPYGRGEEGRGLRWKLNTNLVSLEDLRRIVEELLNSWGGSR